MISSLLLVKGEHWQEGVFIHLSWYCIDNFKLTRRIVIEEQKPNIITNDKNYAFLLVQTFSARRTMDMHFASNQLNFWCVCSPCVYKQVCQILRPIDKSSLHNRI